MSPRRLKRDAERRADPRHRVTCSVEVTVGVPCCGGTSVTDLSAGGCFVKCAEAVREGEVVKLLFRAGPAGDLTVWGDVTHAESGGFGLRFTAFSRGGARDLLASVLPGEGRGD